MKQLRKIIAASIVAAAITPLIASAHEGHDHEAEEAAKPTETTQQAGTTVAAATKDKETGQEVNTGIDPVLVAIGAGGLGIIGAIVIGGAYIAGNKRAARIAKNKKK